MSKVYARYLETIVNKSDSLAAYFQEDSEAITCRKQIDKFAGTKRPSHWLHLSEGVLLWAGRGFILGAWNRRKAR